MISKKLVEKIFSAPTAPFREFWVSEAIEEVLNQKRIPYYIDTFGNIVAGVRSKAGLKGKRKIAFMAHMDHPGFHITKKIKVSAKRSMYQAKWFGGAPFKKMHGAKLRAHDPLHPADSHIGTLKSIDLSRKTRTKPLTIQFDKKVDLSPGSFGAFAYPAFQFRGSRLSARCCDDLAGVVIALGALIDTFKTKNCIAIFTRAEEVGFVGCWAQLLRKEFPENILFLSLEASKELPGARLGKGPVLRLGDRMTLFDSAMIRYMWSLSEKLKQKNRSYKYQRRILDGGSCEATALGLFGKTAAGISLPLFNYHNEGPTKPGPEVVDMKDLENARLLCTEMTKNLKDFDKIQGKMKLVLQANYMKFKPHLQKSAKYVSRLD